MLLISKKHLHLSLLSAGNQPASLDSTFDGDGKKILTEITELVDAIYEMRVLGGSDANAGKILAVGAINDCLGLLRFNADLTLDPSFGANGNGIIQTEVDSGAHGRALTLDKHNNILVVGGNKIGRFNSDGSLDTDFGSNGYSNLASSPSTRGSMVPTDVVIQPDGRILVSYYVLGNDPITSYNWAKNVAYARSYFHIVRFTANGQIELEKSHDVGDYSTTDNYYGDTAAGLAVQEDGDILMMGGFQDRSNVYGFGTLRLNELLERDDNNGGATAEFNIDLSNSARS